MEQIRESQGLPILSLCDVNVRYPGKEGGIQALQSIRLTVRPGEFIGILGPSGCGKSTLMRILAGFMPPSSGEARMDDRIIQGPDWRRGVIFQEPTLYAWLDVRENIAFGLKMRKFPKEERQRLTKEYIELVGLTGFERSKPYELSGGMKQRVCLARALVNQPDVLLMDEPFGALDALTRRNMQKLTREIREKTGSTVLLVTHDVDEALCLATRILVMSARPGRILSEFRTDFIRRFSQGEEGVEYLPEYRELREKILAILQNQYMQ
ncbi:ABC transporter ATP-binding protein [Eubacteriales bacterium mix99]